MKRKDWLVTVKELSEIILIPRRTITYYIQKGSIPARKFDTQKRYNPWYINRKDVQDIYHFFHGGKED